MRLDRVFLLTFFGLALAIGGCGSDRTIVYVDGGGTGSDSGGGASDAGPPFDAGPDYDAGPRPDSGPARDSGGAMVDAGVGTGVMCSNTCLATPGAVCCTMCGCSAEVRCTPVCPDGYVWDCELTCCFDRTAFHCLGM